MLQFLEADISLFDLLIKVAETHNVSLQLWAGLAFPDAAGNPQSRISELKKISTLVADGLPQAKASELVGRKCTYQKLIRLWEGLVKMIGSGIAFNTYKELMDAASPVEQWFLMFHQLDGHPETRTQLIEIIRPIVEAKILSRS